VKFTAKLIDDKDGFFATAERLSHGLFLLLYVITVAYHVIEFFKDQGR